MPMQVLCVVYKSRGLNIAIHLPLLTVKAVPARGEKAKKRSRVRNRMKLHKVCGTGRNNDNTSKKMSCPWKTKKG